MTLILLLFGTSTIIGFVSGYFFAQITQRIRQIDELLDEFLRD